MTLKTSFINFGIVKHNLKRYWWVSAISFGILFITTILRIILCDLEYYADRIARFPTLTGTFLNNDAGIIILIPTASVLAAICVLRYLQSPKNATLIHSLPPKRTTIFTSTFLSGIILFALPIILAAIILLCLSLSASYGILFTTAHVFKWCGLFLLYGLVFYSFSIFAGMFTGSSVAQFLFTYIFLALPFGIVALSSALLDGWLYSFIEQATNPVFETLLKITPFHYILAVTDFNKSDIKLWQYFLMGGYIIVCYATGLFFYSKRNIENSGDIVAFKFIRPIFLYGVTICCSLAGAALIKGLTSTDNASLLALIIFGVIGYAVAKMLLIKSFRIIKYYKGALVFVCVAIIFWLSITFNIFGFGKSAPDASNVEKAFIGTYLYSDWYTQDTDKTYYGMGTQNVVFTQRENIEALIKLQQNAIDGVYPQGKNRELTDTYVKFCISYKMKNGSIKSREYTLDKNDAFLLLSTPEAKDYMFPYLRTKSEDIYSINVYVSGKNRAENSLTFSTPEEQAAFIEILQKDIETLSYDKLFEYTNDLSVNAEFSLDLKDSDDPGYAYMNINKYFENTIAFLSEYSSDFAQAASTEQNRTEIVIEQ